MPEKICKVFVKIAWVTSMKKLLITLRHPGPCQNVFAVLDKLTEHFEVSLILTDAAINCAMEAGVWKGKVTIYIPIWKGESLSFSEGLQKKEKSPRMEFADDETEQYEVLYRALYQIVDMINPDVVLRTTPVFLWGVDELIPTVLKEQNKLERLRCYQECYCAGKALTENENKIARIGCESLAVVDVCAARHSVVPRTTVVGYLNVNHLTKGDYVQNRKRARDKMAITDSDNAFLYVASSIYDLKTELFHFKVFLNCARKYEDEIKIFLKFHPRHNTESKEMYRLAVLESGCQIYIIEDMEYKGLLAFSDCMISLGSSVNIDAVNYLSFNIGMMKDPPSFVSVYPYGKDVARVMKKIYNTDFYPPYDKNGCHIIVDENNYDQIFEAVIQGWACSDDVLKKYENNGKSNVDAIDGFINYLKQ